MAFTPFNDPRAFAATGAKPPGKFDWAGFMNVIGGGLMDLGGYSGGGHMQNAIAMNSWNQERRLAEQQKQSQANAEGTFLGAMAQGNQDPKALMASVLQYARMGGDLSKIGNLSSILKMGAPPSPLSVGKNDRLVDPTTYKEILPAVMEPKAPLAGAPGTIYRDPNDPSKILAQNPDTPKLLSPEEEAQRLRIAGAGKPTTTINMPGDNAYASTVGKGLGERDLTILDTGRTAPQRYENAQRVLDILADGKAITGTGADWRLGFARAAATAGLASPDDAAATETLASTLASQTLDAIKSSGLGSGQGFTDKDRQFLERAKAGQITMTPQALKDLATLNKKSAIAAIRQSNEVAKRVGADPRFGEYSKSLMIDEPSNEWTTLPNGIRIRERKR